VQEQVAEVAEAFYQRAYELAVLLARAVTGRWWSSPLIRLSAPTRRLNSCAR